MRVTHQCNARGVHRTARGDSCALLPTAQAPYAETKYRLYPDKERLNTHREARQKREDASRDASSVSEMLRREARRADAESAAAAAAKASASTAGIRGGTPGSRDAHGLAFSRC